MTITIGAPVDAFCPKCSANALVVTAVTNGEMSQIQCQECEVSYPDGADRGPLSGDTPRKRERGAGAGAGGPAQQPSQGAKTRGETLLDVAVAVEQQRPKGRRRTGTLLDLEVDLKQE